MNDIYFITDSSYGDVLEQVRIAVKKKVAFVQYREKNLSRNEMVKICNEIRNITLNSNTLFIINDYFDIAIEVGADGIHIGPEDINLKDVRHVFPGIIGVSVSSVNEAKKAELEGADYLGVGAIFKTFTKKVDVVGIKILKDIINEVSIPVVAIGGINENNIKKLPKEIDYIAMISALLDGDIEKRIDLMRDLL